MKIVHIGPSEIPVISDKGGAVQRRMLELAYRQAEQGLDVTVLSPESRFAEQTVRNVRIVSLPVRARRPLRDVEFLLQAKKWQRSNGVADVLHAHGVPQAAQALGAKYGRTVLTVDFFRYRLSNRRLGHALVTKWLNQFDAVMPVSDYCQREFEAFYPNLSTEVTMVPNGVSLDQFRPSRSDARLASDSLSLPSAPLVVYLGRVCHQKGSDRLGPLAEDLARSQSPAKVVAAGPPEQFGADGRSELMESLARQGVLCLGAVDERYLNGLLAAAAVVVLPTRANEMFGMAAVEALAAGTSVVASELGGIPQAVGSAGYLFDPDVAGDFCQKVLTAMNERGSAKDADNRAQASSFAWPVVERLTRDVYDSNRT